MGSYKDLYEQILLRRSDANVPFRELCELLKQLGFNERIKGDHHIFWLEGINEIINIQPKSGRAKPYQVNQIRVIITKYGIRLRGNDEL